MTRGDIIGLVLSYVYAFGMLMGVEALGKALKWPQSFTRKIIHIGAGLWLWGQLYFFDHWYFGIIPFATFIILNYIFYRQQTFEQMDSEESSPGTVYFAVSITILMVAFWRTGGGLDRVPYAAAAIMAMTIGDAMASILGRRFGKRTYTTFEHTRSWEGSAAMVVFSFVAIYLVLTFLPGSALSPNSAVIAPGNVLILSVVGTIIAAAAEGLSPAGTDNLSVPLLTGLALFLLGSVL